MRLLHWFGGCVHCACTNAAECLAAVCTATRKCRAARLLASCKALQAADAAGASWHVHAFPSPMTLQLIVHRAPLKTTAVPQAAEGAGGVHGPAVHLPRLGLLHPAHVSKKRRGWVLGPLA